MYYSAIIVDEKGKPIPGVTAGILPAGQDSYSLDDTGFWSVSGNDGMINIYTVAGITNEVLALFSKDGRSVVIFKPAAAYQGQTIVFEQAGKITNWLVLAIIGITGYFLIKKGKK